MAGHENDERALEATRSTEAKEYLYVLDGGTILASPGRNTPVTVRRTVSILLALDAPFDVCVGNVWTRQQAIVIKPLMPRRTRAAGTRFVAFFVNPMDPRFAAFRTIPSSGFMPLAREAFEAFNPMLERAFRGRLDAPVARALHADVAALAARCLPDAGPLDPRIEQAVGMLRRNPTCRLGELARAVGLSPGRLSHLFSESLGISLRSYVLWFKMSVALEILEAQPRLTDAARVAGFADLAHFSREFQRAFGAPLSYFRDASRAQIRQYRASSLVAGIDFEAGRLRE